MTRYSIILCVELTIIYIYYLSILRNFFLPSTVKILFFFFFFFNSCHTLWCGYRWHVKASVVPNVVQVPGWKVPVSYMVSVIGQENSGSWTSVLRVCVIVVRCPATHHLASTSTNLALLDGRLDYVVLWLYIYSSLLTHSLPLLSSISINRP